MEIKDRLVSFDEAAQAWGVKTRTVRWWAQTGKIATHKFGEPGSRAGRRMVPVSEINRLIEESRVPARVAA